MNRRVALTLAGSAALVVTAASGAVAANLGILGAAADEPVGRLDANTVTELSSPVSTVDPAVVTVEQPAAVGADQPTDTAPAATAAPSGPAVSAGSGAATGGATGHDDDAVAEQEHTATAPVAATAPSTPTSTASSRHVETEDHPEDHGSQHEVEDD